MRTILLLAVLITACGKSESDKQREHAKAQLEKRRSFAAAMEDEMRRAGTATKVTLRGTDETVLVINGMLGKDGHDWCTESLWKPAAEGVKTRMKSPDSDDARWAAAGIARVECESSNGRVFGYDLKQ